MVRQMRGWLDSPRRRKRVLVLVVVAVAAVLATVLGLQFTNTAKPQKETFEEGPAQITREQVPKRLAAADRRAVLAVVDRFVRLGVAGKDLAAAYDLTTANFHGGITRKQWARGDTPIYPYPVFRHGARIAASYENDVMVQLYLRARSRKVEPLGVDVELRAIGTGAKRHWLVDYYLPRQTLVTADRPAPGPALNDPGRLGPHLTERWLLVPLGIFLLILLVPLGIVVRHWAAARAADRAYGEGRELPPLPPRPGRES
jgi:hypothetical protein